LDQARAAVLQQLVDETLAEAGNPRNITVTIHQSTFVAAYEAIRSDLTRSAAIPTLAFIDPFGWTGMPLSVVEDLIRRPSNEVLINFMFEEINRFLGHPDQGENFDALFGSAAWKGCITLSGLERNRCLRDAYGTQLSAAGAKYVRYFEMRNSRDTTDYYLFFATRNYQGLKKMKEAMWKVDESGEFRFSDATDPFQTVLFNEPNYNFLKAQIVKNFSGKDVSVEQIERFVVEHTAFRETHYKLQVLKPMEAATSPELVVVSAKPGRKRGTFPVGTVVRFA